MAEVCTALFASTFIHEDVAIVAASYLVDEQHVSFLLAAVVLYAGVVASDLAVYGLGASARRLNWARRFLGGIDHDRASGWVNRHLYLLIALSRIVPGLLVPAFTSCGWFKAPIRRFMVCSMITAVPFTLGMLSLFVFFGGSVLHGLGVWAWILLLLLLLGLSLLITRKAGLNLLEQDAPQAGSPGWHLIGLLPDSLFYTPFTLYWIWLGLRHRGLTLPSAANPCIEGGGCWGESKALSLDGVSAEQRRWIAPYTRIVVNPVTDEDAAQEALHAMRAAGVDFPCIAKPDIGWKGFGVRRIDDAEELREYIRDFPCGAAMLLQEYIPYDGEAGVFYVRKPGEAEGCIYSLSLVDYPHVIGDGNARLRDLILQNPRTSSKAGLHLGDSTQHRGIDRRILDAVPAAGERVRLSTIGSERVGSTYRDARHLVTPAMTSRFDAIAKSMPEFHFGRFDVRFQSLEGLQRGEDFYILEINGACSEPLHIWDPGIPPREKYRQLLEALSLLFEVGGLNRSRGIRPMGIRDLLGLARKQRRLIRQYPPSS